MYKTCESPDDATVQGFGCKLVYYGRHEKPAMKELGGVEFEPDLEAFVGRCDIITINIPLTNKTRFVHPSQICC